MMPIYCTTTQTGTKHRKHKKCAGTSKEDVQELSAEKARTRPTDNTKTVTFQVKGGKISLTTQYINQQMKAIKYNKIHPFIQYPV
jgi:predicted nucleotidyltransferase